jgi:hypothetical protein
MDYDIDISDRGFLCCMSKQKKYSDAGKGDKSRVTDKKKFDKNWEKIFGKKRKNIRKFYSSEDCKIDDNGGPHEIDLSKLGKNNK